MYLPALNATRAPPAANGAGRRKTAGKLSAHGGNSEGKFSLVLRQPPALLRGDRCGCHQGFGGQGRDSSLNGESFRCWLRARDSCPRSTGDTGESPHIAGQASEQELGWLKATRRAPHRAQRSGSASAPAAAPRPPLRHRPGLRA